MAARTAKAGYTALIVEKELVGGDCPFWACVPNKVSLHSGAAFRDARAVAGAWERLLPNAAGPDPNATFQRPNLFVAGWDDTKMLIPMTESSGLWIVRGCGRLSGVREVTFTDVSGKIVVLKARLAVVICTGSEPVLPADIAGLDAANPWTPRDATSSQTVPKHFIIIIGAGEVGAEMATAYSDFGSKVTLVSSSDEILACVDREAGKIVRESLHGRESLSKPAFERRR